MSNRLLIGQLPDGQMGIRVSKPGFDVLAEPLGSANIAFDSREVYLDGLWKLGVCGLNQQVPYPATPQFQPILRFAQILGDGSLYDHQRYQSNDASGNISGWIYQGQMFSSFFVITVFTNWFTPPYDAGAVFAYALLKGGA
jgi:hypothetical protein